MKKKIFKKADWIHNTNVYEVNLRQYTDEGTINAFVKELPRLRKMGVHTLWFMPITPISIKNRKGTMGSYYACSDYISVSPEFGSLEDFRSLVKHAHELGFKVIIDWVANHTGWDHIWTTEHPEYYLKDETTGDFKAASGMDDIIELDYKNPALRKAMIEAMEFWVRSCDIDGFRCDLAYWVELAFWKEARTHLDKVKAMFWLAEADVIDNHDYMTVFDAAYAWKWMHLTEEFYKKNLDIAVLIEALKRYNDVSRDNSMALWFSSNHDENSWNGTEYEKYADMAKALAVFSFTWNGVPLIYSGQELPNLKRLEFFYKDVIAWNDHYQLHEFYNKLLDLHTNNPALRAADAAVATHLLTITHFSNVLAYVRKNAEHEVLTLLNLSNEKVGFELKDEQLSGQYRNVFNKTVEDITHGKQIQLEPWGYVVYEK